MGTFLEGIGRQGQLGDGFFEGGFALGIGFQGGGAAFQLLPVPESGSGLVG